jgi:glycosyltransferase involved in cell wall biosynthesis
MVKLMLDRLGADRRREAKGTKGTPRAPGEIECYHVNAQFSEDMEDIGVVRFGKIAHVLKYCIEAIWCRFRYGLKVFYYVPAPGKRAALYRDWIVMLICRPFFKAFVYHWHAVGLGDWLHREGNWAEKWITHRLLGHPALSLVLAVPGMRDALWFKTKRVEIVPNGIPDPCPDFEQTVLPLRTARMEARKKLLAGYSLTPEERERAGGDPEVFKILYLAHCTREKGLFDTLEAVALANARLADSGSPLRMRLTVGGMFMTEKEHQEFNERIAREDLRAGGGGESMVDYKGFVSGAEKERLLRESDGFCFPTYYPAEGQPVNLIEALAHGLPLVTTPWRGIVEIVPPGFAFFAEPKQPATLASALLRLTASAESCELRKFFQEKYSLEIYIERLKSALLSLESGRHSLPAT